MKYYSCSISGKILQSYIDEAVIRGESEIIDSDLYDFMLNITKIH